jgi:hypothetical protein
LTRLMSQSCDSGPLPISICLQELCPRLMACKPRLTQHLQELNNHSKHFTLNQSKYANFTSPSPYHPSTTYPHPISYKISIPTKLPTATAVHAAITTPPYAKNVGPCILLAAPFELELPPVPLAPPPFPVAVGGVPLPLLPIALSSATQVLAVCALCTVALPPKLHALLALF